MLGFAIRGTIDVICIAYAYLHLPICICLHAREARSLARDVQRRAPVGGGEVEQAAVLLEPGLGLKLGLGRGLGSGLGPGLGLGSSLGFGRDAP